MQTTDSKSIVSKIAPSVTLALLLVFFLTRGAMAVDATIPPYKTSGSIAGTELLYDRLKIESNGKATIIISNPGKTGQRFVANFSFYTEKGAYLTGFSIEGFAGRMSNTSYAFSVPGHKSLKKAAYMKALGRSGRTSDN